MAKKKQEKNLPAVVEHGSLRLLTETLEAKLSKSQVAILKEMGHTIVSTGMGIGDAALLARTTLEEVNEWTKEVPEIGTYFRLKTVEYKRDLLQVVNSHAKSNKDVKQANWLLEQHFDEYNTAAKKAKQNKPDKDDFMALAIEFVRKRNSEGTPIEAQEGEKDRDAEVVAYQTVDEILK